jgi:hypothetical protein
MITSTSFKHAAAASLKLLTLAMAGRASAQQPSQEQIGAIRSACRADYQARCVGVQPGGPEALACLKKNVAMLSPGCQKAVGSVDGGAAQKSGEAVAANPPGAAVPATEPNAATNATSAAPVAAVAPPAAAPTVRAASTMAATRPAAAPRAELAVLRQACGRDYQANCAGVRPGGGQAIACLAANQARLSPGCQRALVTAKQSM